MASIDDPVLRVVEAAMAAQTRLLLAYLEAERPRILQEALTAMRSEFGGERAYFSKGTEDRNRGRDEAIRRDRQAGLSVRALAKKYHLSIGRIQEISKGRP